MIAAAAAAIAFGILVGIGGARLTGTRRRWFAIVYAATFLGMSVSVVVALVPLYSEGAQAKTSALANSLGQRLNSIFQSGLNITEIQGRDEIFVEYQQLDPDISAAGLIVDKLIAIHTDARQVGRAWTSDPTTHEYQVDLTRPAGRDSATRPGGRDIRLFVALPVDVIYRQIGRSMKNFAALFMSYYLFFVASLIPAGHLAQ